LSLDYRLVLVSFSGVILLDDIQRPFSVDGERIIRENGTTHTLTRKLEGTLSKNLALKWER